MRIGYATDQKLNWSFRGFHRRGDALTLVIDETHGTLTVVSYCLSKRSNTENAVTDLVCREGTTVENITVIKRGIEQASSRNPEARVAITAWLDAAEFDSAIWTDLESNFQRNSGAAFSVESAIRHIQELEPQAKVKAAEYIWRAPSFVQTNLRRTLEVPPWFGALADAQR